MKFFISIIEPKLAILSDVSHGQNVRYFAIISISHIAVNLPNGDCLYKRWGSSSMDGWKGIDDDDDEAYEKALGCKLLPMVVVAHWFSSFSLGRSN